MAIATAKATPDPTPEATTARKVRKAHHGYGLGPTAPSPNLPFPTHANLTVVELLTFLPNSTRCADVIYRFISNGGSRQALWAIINTQRDLLVEWSANSCGVTIYKAMHEAGYKDWTVTIHHKWHDEKKAIWNEARLDVAGFRTPGQITGLGALAQDVPFKDLAVDVKRIPQGYDALDLTRMVQYCVQKPNEPWLYPCDFDELLTVLGGPVVVQREHLDGAAFKRWSGITPPPPRLGLAGAASQLTAETKEKKRKRSSAVRGDTLVIGVLSRGATPVSEPQSRGATPTPAVQSRGTTPMTAMQPKNMGRPRGKPKTSVRDEERVEGIAEQMEIDDDTTPSEPYVRTPAEYIAPAYDAEEPPDESIDLAFLAEGSAGENDPFGLYAFGGPRGAPPYRSLHRIDQPHPADVSGWAENLRWACEQRACFWHSRRTDGWNESPEHMELIAKTRREQVWASDELLQQLREEEDRELEKYRRMVYPEKRG